MAHASGKVSLLVLAVIAVVTISPALGASVRWTPDSLFYQAQMYELRGESQTAADEPASRARIRADDRDRTRDDDRAG